MPQSQPNKNLTIDNSLSVAIAVRRIKMLSFFIDEQNIPLEAIFQIDFGQTIQFNIENSLLFFNLRVYYTLANLKPERIVLDSMIQNIFELANIQNHVENENQLRLPNETIVSLVSLSIGHARSLISHYAGGTIFQDTLIPVVNPVAAAIAFFPERNFQEPKDLGKELTETVNETFKKPKLKKEEISVMESIQLTGSSSSKKTQKT
jgi:hypothetical protein